MKELFISLFCISEDICKTRWKSLRDRFRKEKNKEREMRRSGAGSSVTQPWRFMAVMGFLTPFITDRETSSNVQRPPSFLPSSSSVRESLSPDPEDSQAEGSSQSNSQQAPAGRDEKGNEEDSQADRGRQTEAGRQTMVARHMEQEETRVANKGRKRKGHEMSAFEREMLSAIEPLTQMASLPRPPLPQTSPEDEDEMFFKSLSPSIRRLPLTRRARLRFEIHQLVYQAELEAADVIL